MLARRIKERKGAALKRPNPLRLPASLPVGSRPSSWWTVEPIRFPAQEPIRFPAQRPANVALPRHYDSHLRSIFRKHARGFDLISPFRGAGLVSAKPPSIRGGPLAIWDRSPRQPVARTSPHGRHRCVFPLL